MSNITMTNNNPNNFWNVPFIITDPPLLLLDDDGDDLRRRRCLGGVSDLSM